MSATRNKITYDGSGNPVAFIGPTAVAIFQAAALRAGIGLMAVGVRPHRTWTSMTKALAAASTYTGRKYRRTEHEQAREDLGNWIAIMKATVEKETQS